MNDMGNVVKKADSIRLNQVGYRPNDEKVAFITSAEQTFMVCDSDNNLVFTGDIVPSASNPDGTAVIDEKSGDILGIADFSSISKKGKYYLKAGNDRSSSFQIGPCVYEKLANAVLKLFYIQRCGGEGVKTEYSGGLFAHDPCHSMPAKYFDETDPIYGKVYTDVSGGWHDAGDYGRYVTPAAKTVVDLLLSIEHFPYTADLDFGGPVKLLQETRYELEWLLKMQNRETGGVYHKVTTQIHANIACLPEDDNVQLFLSPVSAQATGSFAAAEAYASRIYRKSDPEFSATCLQAAEKAWNWLINNPETDAYIDPAFFRTGSYNDKTAYDERYWAATELHRTTGASEYLTYMTKNPLPDTGFGWANIGSYAMVSYLTSERADKTGMLYKNMLENYITSVDKIISLSKKDGYRVSLDRYVWGSNMDIANNAMALIFADKISPNPDYKNVILDQFHYLMGRNANSISYVTCYGENSARKPHHRQSIIFAQAVPGMLVGGPFERLATFDRDPVSKMFDEKTPPSKCYMDAYESFSSNEICIYWNSPLAFILGYLNGNK